MARGIETALDDFKNNLRSIVVEASKKAAKKIQKDLVAEARKNIAKYYDQYDPDVYERTYDLQKTVIHRGFLNDNSTKNTINLEIGFYYDSMGPHTLRGGSSKYNGNADPEWILDNFVEGIHPRTTKGYVYDPYQAESQNELMDKFVDRTMEKKIDKYMQSELIRAISRLMK